MVLASSTHSLSFLVIFAANIQQIIHPTIRFAELLRSRTISVHLKKKIGMNNIFNRFLKGQVPSGRLNHSQTIFF